MAKNKGGRPSLLTKERRKRICEGIQLGMTYKLAAQYAGISEATLYGWLKRGRSKDGAQYVTLFDAVKEAESKHAALALGSIVKASRDSWQAGAWLLERRHGYNKVGAASTQRDVDTLEGVTDADAAVRLRHQLIEIRGANAIALDSGSFQAYYAGKRLERDLIADLALALADGGRDPVEDLDSEAFRNQLREAVGDWPDALLEIVIAVYEQRHSIALLQVLEGGRGA